MGYKAKQVILFDPINKVYEFVKLTKPFLDEWLNIHTFEGEKLLFHYTTVEGLIGILQNRSLWYSDTRLLNDPNERKYGRDIVLSGINDLLSKTQNDDIKRLFKDIKGFIEGVHRSFYNSYIACFSEDGNLLSQWRAYSNKGTGFSVGFDFNSDTLNLEDTSTNETKEIILRKVIYNPKQQTQIVEDYIKLLCEIVEITEKENQNYKDPGFISQFAMAASNLFFEMIDTFKSEAFLEEKEWRLIKVYGFNYKVNLLRFRPRVNDLVPYLQFCVFNDEENIKKFPVKWIWCGPGTNTEQIMNSVQLLIKHCSSDNNAIKINDDDIKIQHVPFSLK